EFQFQNLKRIDASGCESITKLPDLCTLNLEELDLSYCTNLVEFHESIGSLDKLQELRLINCEKIHYFPSHLMWKSLQILDISSCLSLDDFSFLFHCNYNILNGLYQYCCKNLMDLSDIIYKLRLPKALSISSGKLRSCREFTCFKYLPEIPRLPQSIREVFILNSQLLHPQSSNRLLSQFGELWYPESEISLSPQIPRNVLHCELILPGSEISKWFNHRSVGNSISFWIRRGSPTFCCCVVFESGEQSGEYYLDVIFKFNGTRHRIFQGIWVADMMCNHVLFFHVPYEQASGLLYCSSQCYDHYQNHVEVVFQPFSFYPGSKTTPTIRRDLVKQRSSTKVTPLSRLYYLFSPPLMVLIWKQQIMRLTPLKDFHVDGSDLSLSPYAYPTGRKYQPPQVLVLMTLATFLCHLV
ncbi:disease resistance protein adr2, partial [Quercus suber]